jgi:HlyD family secretion protein
MGGGGGGGGGRGGPGGDFALVLLDLPNPGGRVKKGDVVAEFDRQNMLNRIDDYKDSVIQAEASIKNKTANLAVAREAHNQQLRVSKADMDKAKLDLQTLEVVSAIDAEKLRLAVEETTAHYNQLLKEVPLFDTSQAADLRNAEINRDTSKIELQKSVANAEKMILKAPMDGLVVMQSIRRGMEFGQAQKGDQIYSGQMFMQIVDPASMVVNGNVNQVDAELLRIGQKATVRLDAYPGLELPAHVYSIGAVPVAGRRPNFMRQIPIRLKLDKVDPLVVPDLSASADVTLESEREATLVPLASVFQDGPAGKPYVFLRSPEGWQKRPVELGLQSNVDAVVRSGLSKGDVVALESPIEASSGKADEKPPV